MRPNAVLARTIFDFFLLGREMQRVKASILYGFRDKVELFPPGKGRGIFFRRSIEVNRSDLTASCRFPSRVVTMSKYGGGGAICVPPNLYRVVVLLKRICVAPGLHKQ